LKWTKPYEEELRKYLVEGKGFSEVKVSNGILKLKNTQGKAN